jgi:putative ABC transport system permease protein
MKTSLVWANLLHYRLRTVFGVAGISFAVILMFMQLGFLGAAEATATLLYDQLDFDLLVVSTDYVELTQPGTFPMARLAQAGSHPQVAELKPFYVGLQYWRNDQADSVSESEATFTKRAILVLGFRPQDSVFKLPDIRAKQDRLRLAGKVLFDRMSRDVFGVPSDGGVDDIDRDYWLGITPVQVVGQFRLGSGFTADGQVVTSDQTFARVMGNSRLDLVNLGLIKLKEGAVPQQVAAELKDRLPADVQVWTRVGIEDREQRHWIEDTSIGIVFRCGVVVAVLVGIVFVYQVISSDITSRLKEFATLKAVGYGDNYLSRTVLHQALLLALFGYVPGLLVSFGLYALAASIAGLPIGLSGEAPLELIYRAVVVLALTIGLCSCSGLFAISKLRSANPADLF